jgi:hypothetical protein
MADPDPRDLAERLFGPDPDELPGRWLCGFCAFYRLQGQCPHDPAQRRLWKPADRPAGDPR